MHKGLEVRVSEGVLSLRERIDAASKHTFCGCVLCQLCNRRFWNHQNFSCNEYMFRAIQPQSQKLHWYLDRIISRIERNHSIYLAIVGKDPYPSDPIGLPFAKRTLKETFAATSGKPLFTSLGVDVVKWEQSGRDVKNFYKELCDRGIIFLNISYKFLADDFAKKRVLPYLKCANSYNRYILERCGKVVLCGDADKGTKWSNEDIPRYYSYAEKPWHPSARKPIQARSVTANNADEQYRERWSAYWGAEKRLLDILEPFPVTTIYRPIRNAIDDINNLVI